MISFSSGTRLCFSRPAGDNEGLHFREQVRDMFNIRGFSQNLQHLLLQLLDEIGHVVPAQLDPAHLDLPALEHTK